MPSKENITSETCQQCEGSGQDGIAYIGEFKCKECGGSGTVKKSLTVEPVSNRYKLKDWTEQFDDCDVCELCGNLVAGGKLFERLSAAITLLYTHEIMTGRERDAARRRLTTTGSAGFQS